MIHLAAVVGGIEANRASPATFFYDNLMMGCQLFHHAWRAGVKRFVSVGTVCAYPKHTPVPFREDDLWNGYPEESNAAYGIAKKMLLVQGEAYRQQYGFDSIFLLPANLYGPHDNFEEGTSHVIPALIRRCCEARDSGARELLVWGDGTPTRDFLYVADAAEGIVLATEHYDDIRPLNLGAGRETSIAELVRLVMEVVGFHGDLVWDPSKPNGQPRRVLDVSRAATECGFHATTSLGVGLRRTVEWYESIRDTSAS